MHLTAGSVSLVIASSSSAANGRVSGTSGVPPYFFCASLVLTQALGGCGGQNGGWRRDDAGSSGDVTTHFRHMKERLLDVFYLTLCLPYIP